LVVDDNPDGRSLVSRTLARKFPTAQIVESAEVTEAANAVARHEFDALITHRAGPVDGEELVRQLRKVNGKVPILMVSGFDRSERAKAAGATEFLNYDAWLMIGKVVDKLLASNPAPTDSPPGNSPGAAAN
jgi:CheY-like chemotaxis protein